MSDEMIFLIVVALRLGVPLFIPRFPLPAIIAALVIDAADQTIFQNYTDIDTSETGSYQVYDKALDVYYLTIAYLATIRNWADPFAFRVGQFLWYWRLLGVLLFEFTQTRALLIIFPNTFEYFFIGYELVRLWWKPELMAKRTVILMAAGIWIFIKLPQEWWIHIAKLDFTDFMKEDVFGVSVDTSWGDAISENWWFVGLLAVLAAIIVVLVIRIRSSVRPPDHGFGFDVDRLLDHEQIAAPVDPAWQPVISWYMFEKIMLVAMVTTIFALVLPDNDVSFIGIAIPVAFVIIVNAFASTWLARRGHDWNSIGIEFVVMAVVNLGSALVFILLLRRSDSEVNENATLFFVLLLTLIVTLFDRYHRGTRDVVGTADAPT